MDGDMTGGSAMAGVEITLRDIYDAGQAALVRLDSLEGAMTQMKDTVDIQLGAGQRKMDDHETRIRSLEKLAGKLIGAFAAINALAVVAEWLLWAHK